MVLPGPPWSDDPDTPELAQNLSAVYADVIAHAFSGQAATMALVETWHQTIHTGISAPRAAYIGNLRGSPDTDLLDYEVHIGGIPGVRSYLVYGEVQALLRQLNEAMDELTQADSSGEDVDDKAIALMATVHGEWVRIHPFVNANGRTARLLVTWIGARFGIPPLLRGRPRPAPPYGDACNLSMTGDHSEMKAYLQARYAALP